MKSFRPGRELEEKLERAAQREGVSESEFIRRALEDRADAVLSESIETRWAGIIGAVRSDRGHAAHAHDRYRELLRAEHERIRKSRR